MKRKGGYWYATLLGGATLHVAIFGGAGAGLTHWLFDNPTIGAVFGVASLQLFWMWAFMELINEKFDLLEEQTPS